MVLPPTKAVRGERTKMNHHNDTAIGFGCGILGGTTKFLLDIPHETFAVQAIEAIAIAFLSGVAGVLGKHLITKILKRNKDVQ